ncbi:anti-phage DNA glycosylase Brig1 [Micromonospora sp. IBHARD004]|uniref:anti-phage DNA glycosylase Brig1 n=1 Tax=Micromonospora sp. IBHARD004 TaxID=3457764 RepID=UPI004057E60C
MTTSARERVAAFWDAHIAAWLKGKDQLPSRVLDWFDSYVGVGPGEATREGFPEPYHGDLLGLEHTPRMVVLGLNPGEFRPRFQARDGIFAKEIEQHGSYSRWTTTCPYNRPRWTLPHEMGRNRYYQARLGFTRRWLQDPSADHRELLIFECYPWHSKSITAPLKPPPEVIEEFVWQPIAELPVQDVFAFGRPWDDIAQALGLREVGKLGFGGTDYGSAVHSRAVRIYGLSSGQRLVVEWHSGAAGPPSAKETALLRDALVKAASEGRSESTTPRPRAGASSDRALNPASAKQLST